MHSLTHSTPMGLPQPDDNRLESQVFRLLFDKIRFGDYALGARLPSESELCEEHGVSRPVVRAALSKLRDSGLIVSRQGAGSFVNSGVPTTHDGFTPLGSVTDISSFFRFRRIIEAASAELAAQNADENGVARLSAILEETQDRVRHGEETVQLDIKFHVTIAELSGNRFLAQTVDMLQPHWIFVGNFVRSLGATGERKGRRMAKEHGTILKAIAANDTAAAVAAMLTHIEGSETRVFKGET